MSVVLMFFAQQAPSRTVIEQPFDWAGLLVGALALGGASLGAWWASRDSAKDRKAQRLHELARQYGEALSTAIAWAETPYRVARRTSDDPATLQMHAMHFHDLQEQIVFYQQWLHVESPNIAGTYDRLVDAIKVRTRPSIQDAWAKPPITEAAQMNLGLIYEFDVAQECSDFVTAVRRELKLPEAKEEK